MIVAIDLFSQIWVTKDQSLNNGGNYFYYYYYYYYYLFIYSIETSS